jgi:hypothetical protein
MQHAKQVEILKELMSQVDEKRNVDAGVMYESPASSYTCPDMASREWEAFFRDHAEIIGLSGDLPNPGSFMTVDDFGTPVLAYRDAEGNFRAFLNACRHWGVKLVTEERGEKARFLAHSMPGPMTIPALCWRSRRPVISAPSTSRPWA